MENSIQVGLLEEFRLRLMVRLHMQFGYGWWWPHLISYFLSLFLLSETLIEERENFYFSHSIIRLGFPFYEALAETLMKEEIKESFIFFKVRQFINNK